jgi:multidrug efflux pump subunit AcrA (membrane-fusion protein)
VEKNLYLSSSDKTNTESASKPVIASLRQLRLQADMAKVDYEHALTEYEVQKRLFNKDMTSATSYDSYKTILEIKKIAWKQAELQWKQARIKDETHLENFKNAIRISEANLKLAALELNKSKVKAPFSGIVKEKIVQMGGFIQSGTDLFELMDISKVLVRINIPEKEMRFASVGKAVSIRLDAMPGEEFQGTIKTLGLEADIKCRCFPADVVIENKQQRLLPGMMAKVKMLAFADSNQVIIPRHAVLEKLRGSVVFVVRNGKAVQIPVVPGQMVEENVQIIKGLNFGDKLVVVGQDLLANNEPVSVVNANHKFARK